MKLYMTDSSGNAYKPRLLLDHGEIADLLDDVVEHFLAVLGMRHLSSAEHDRDLDLVALLQKPLDVPRLELEIVFLDVRPHLDLFHLRDVLLALGFTIGFGLLVLVPAVVHDPADGRPRVGRDLYEIHALLACGGHGLIYGNDPELGAVCIDESDR